MAGMGLTSLTFGKFPFGNNKLAFGNKWIDPLAEVGPSQEFPWEEVIAVARDFVSRESPDAVWPFERVGPEELANSERKVFLHYFTPFPLSFDNKPPDEDYYRRQYLEREGENGKFVQVGGYLRERPLGAGTIPGPHWRAVNIAIDVLRAQKLGADGFGVDLQQLDKGRSQRLTGLPMGGYSSHLSRRKNSRWPSGRPCSTA
jgi:hypothetical protein